MTTRLTEARDEWAEFSAKFSKGNGNLKPVRTEAEAREKGRRGGIASGAARRHKASLRAAIKTALAEPYQGGFMEEPHGLTYAEQAAVQLVKTAASGDIQAVKALLQMERFELEVLHMSKGKPDNGDDDTD